MEKIKFEKPEISIILVNSEDIITTSIEEVSLLGPSVWTPWEDL